MPFNFPQDPPHLIPAEWLAQHLEDAQVRILDARLPENYAEGHIPLAVHVQLTALRYNRDGVDGMLIEPDVFAEAAQRLGIGADTLVVVYDDYYGQLAARIGWSLLRYGHDKVALLDGGWEAWEAAGLPVSTEVKQPEPASFVPVLVEKHIAEHAWVVEHLHAPDVVLLDVRSPLEYNKGHLPNAVAWNWENGTSLEATTFRPAAELLSELAQLGVTPDKEIVTYCQSGMRAAHTFYLLLNLGFKRVRMYDGSWAEWSFREGNTVHAS